MKNVSTLALASIVLVFSFTARAQSSPELLQPVGRGQAQRLEEYNSVFLEEVRYLASRYRIVRVNTNLLLQDRGITVTPFDDVDPIRLEWLNTRRVRDDTIAWHGYYTWDGYSDLVTDGEEPSVEVTINLNAWDIDSENKAELSFQNRFEFSPAWRFDESGSLINDGDVIATTPPPETPEQIERHRRLQSLNKRAFYSTHANFNGWGGEMFVLTHLKLTPRYAVIFERAPHTIPSRIDISQGEELSPNDKLIFERYQTFRDSLPSDEDKLIRGELQ